VFDGVTKYNDGVCGPLRRLVAARGYRDALAVARSANEMSGRADGGFIPIQRSTGSPSPAAGIPATTITQNTCVLVELGVDEAIPPKLQTEPDETAIPASSQRAGERRGGHVVNEDSPCRRSLSPVTSTASAARTTMELLGAEGESGTGLGSQL